MKKFPFLLMTCALALVACTPKPVAPNATQSLVVEDGGTGPVKVLMLEDPTLEAHTIFAPQDLSAFGKKNLLPVLVWGNGACTNSPWEHFKFLNEIASQGFLVIASGYIPMEEKPYRGPQSTSAQQIESIEWALAQNADKNSPYYGKLDIDNIAAAGMSCGGLQALHMSDDARIKTIMVMNSGYFGTDESEDKASLAKLKQKSIIWILGGSTDIAWENGNDDFKRMAGTMPACLVSLDGIGHGGTYMQPNGGDYAKVAGAWLKWWLKGDKEASTMFTGSEPGVSKMAGWSIERKNIK